MKLFDATLISAISQWSQAYVKKNVKQTTYLPTYVIPVSI